jgi:hypothetical protein
VASGKRCPDPTRKLRAEWIRASKFGRHFGEVVGSPSREAELTVVADVMAVTKVAKIVVAKFLAAVSNWNN